ncbi:MAG: MBL fold metallo-hydrolase [Saprospiraceae bacterium]
MKVEQWYTGCLAQGAYYVESDGEIAIIDPLRETAPYLQKAEENGAKIKYVFETHFHADFVSGHVDLAKKSGAAIVFGPGASTDYQMHNATDGEIFKVGKLQIKALHTPGHTMESTSYLLYDENGKPYCIFTGDTLFIGDVGRPDLAIKGDLTQEDLAGMLYDSLRTKIMTLPDDVIVYPAHGAGSACGKNMSKETFDTLGHQKQVNYALQDIDKATFVKELTTGIDPAPQYFAKNAQMNKMGYLDIDTVLEQGTKSLDIELFEQMANHKMVMILDVRKPQDFAKGFVPGSINIGLDGQFAPWVGALITDLQQPILLVCEQGREEETVKRLARVGYDNALGFLAGGFEAWQNAGKPIDTIESISATDFAEEIKTHPVKIIDVRKNGEYNAEHLEDAIHMSLDNIEQWIGSFDPAEKAFIHCAGGYRSMIAASILKARGYHDIVNIAGGFSAISKTDLPKSSFACQSKLSI